MNKQIIANVAFVLLDYHNFCVICLKFRRRYCKKKKKTSSEALRSVVEIKCSKVAYYFQLCKNII